jgi:hypothetical protein
MCRVQSGPIRNARRVRDRAYGPAQDRADDDQRDEDGRHERDRQARDREDLRHGEAELVLHERYKPQEEDIPEQRSQGPSRRRHHHGLGVEHAADLPGAGAEAAQDPHLPGAFDEGEGQRAYQADQGDADYEQAERLEQGDDGIVGARVLRRLDVALLDRSRAGPAPQQRRPGLTPAPPS